MGAPFGKPYVQWSQGEYPDANLRENDLVIIAAQLGKPVDEAGDSIATAAEIGVRLTVQEGLISPAANGAVDIDYYRFTLPEAVEALLEITPVIIDEDEDEFFGTNLSMQAVLLNEAENPVAQITPTNLPATNRLTYAGALEASTYYLKIQASSPDTNWVTGFGEYGNGGRYRISLNTIANPDNFITWLNPTVNANSIANLDGELVVSKWEHAFLRFDTSAINGTVNNAILRVYHDGRQVPLTLYVGEADDNWSAATGTPPRTLIHTNPEIQLATAAVTGAGYIEIDLTSYVASQVSGDGIVSLELSTDQDSWSRISSMQGLFPPELVITTDGDNQPPEALFSATPLSGPAPHDVSFDASDSNDPDGNIVSYSWDMGDGSSASGITAFHTYNQPGTYTVTLTVTDAAAATATDTALISVTNTPGGTTSLFPTDDANNRAELVGELVVSKWEHAFLRFDVSSIVGEVSNAVLGVCLPGVQLPLTLYVGETEDNWSEATGTSAVTYIHDNPDLQLAAADVTVPCYFEIDLTDYVASQVNGDGIVSLEISSDTNYWSRLISREGIVPPKLEITIAGGSNQPPEAFFSATPSNGFTPLDVSLDAGSSKDPDGNIISYVWDFGDGDSATGVTAFHTYAQAGDYTVTLTVTDDGGLSDTASTVVNVNNSPGGTVTLNPTDDANSTANLDAELVVSKWEHAFLRFNTSAIDGTMNNATLRLYHDGRLVPLILYVGEADDNWSAATGTPPRTLIHNNPALQLATTSVTAAGYIEIDLTSYVASQVSGDGIVSLELSTDQDGWSRISSMEGLLPPELVIETINPAAI